MNLPASFKEKNIFPPVLKGNHVGFHVLNSSLPGNATIVLSFLFGIRKLLDMGCVSPIARNQKKKTAK